MTSNGSKSETSKWNLISNFRIFWCSFTRISSNSSRDSISPRQAVVKMMSVLSPPAPCSLAFCASTNQKVSCRNRCLIGSGRAARCLKTSVGWIPVLTSRKRWLVCSIRSVPTEMPPPSLLSRSFVLFLLSHQLFAAGDFRGTPRTPSREDHVIRIAGLFEMSDSSHPSHGLSELDTARMAIEDVNNEGVLQPFKLELVAGNTKVRSDVNTSDCKARVLVFSWNYPNIWNI